MKSDVKLVTDIMGKRIISLKGEDIGVVQNLIVNPQDGTILFLVLCYADFLGKINRLFVIPSQYLEVNNEKTSLAFKLDERILKHTPCYTWSTDNFPNDKMYIYELVS